MKKILFSMIAGVFFYSQHNYTLAQDKKDPVLLTIGGKNISKSEFEKIYKKNNTKDAAFDKKSLNDYLDLYINYKLKVTEAEAMRLDTGETFKNELVGYRKQLSQPYLTSKEATEYLIKEAYQRLKTDVRAGHILIRVAPDALPNDTLKAYNRTMKIREMVLKGQDFGKIARDSSEDPSAKENYGDLGYFTALQMVYPFENAVYSTKVGEITMPVRTRFGYHLIKVVDTRPAQGEIHVAHIMVKTPAGISADDSTKAKSKIDEIYQKLKAGGNFEDLAKQFSDDPSSSKNGGVLPWFGTGRMVIEFEQAAYGLQKNGDFSVPIKTAYGWHIVKRLDKKDIATYEDMQGELKNRIAKDSRSEVSKIFMINEIKKLYKFKEFSKTKEDFYKIIDSTFFNNIWTVEKAKSLTKPMFTLLDKNYTQQDFAKYLAAHQLRKNTTTVQNVVNSLYTQFVDETCMNVKESRLELEVPEFKTLMDEYRDGILLFELTDKKVWSKAVKDSVGLKEFHEKNKNNYMWEKRIVASIYTCANEDVAKQVRKLLKKGLVNDTILKQVNKTSPINLTVKEGKFLKGENEQIDSTKWVVGTTENKKLDKSVVFIDVRKVLEPQPKTLEEAKGLVTADYQAYLEKDWIDSLRKKYAVVVNKEVLGNITQ